MAGKVTIAKVTIDRCRQMLGEGYSYGRIAWELDVTRNAVASMVARHCAGIVRHKSVKGPTAKRALTMVDPKPKPMPLKPGEVPPPRNVGIPEPTSLALDMEDLMAGQCRYPHGDAPFTFCGQPQNGEHSYCAYHVALTHQGGSVAPSLSDSDQPPPNDHPVATS